MYHVIVSFNIKSVKSRVLNRNASCSARSILDWRWPGLLRTERRLASRRCCVRHCADVVPILETRRCVSRLPLPLPLSWLILPEDTLGPGSDTDSSRILRGTSTQQLSLRRRTVGSSKVTNGID